MLEILENIAETSPVLIAGPTASGKSALALEIARRHGGVIVNADALQVFDCWQVLSARPDASETALAPHALYGHVPYRDSYSTGHWLRDVAPFLQSGPRPIIVGGTGLNFTALTQGLADIPATAPEIRAEADARTPEALRAQLEAEDPVSARRIDLENPARVQRAWEVLRGTGRGIAAWQDATPPPLLPLDQAVGIVIEAPKDWLTPRIERRFDGMLESGALDEVRAMKDDWDPARPSAKAIGAAELVAYLDDILSLDEAKARAIIATRQYAKRQRTWFRARMSSWHQIPGQIL